MKLSAIHLFNPESSLAVFSVPIVADYDVGALREQQFPITRDTVYLNHGGVSPLPRRTVEAMAQANEVLMLNPLNGWNTIFQQRISAFYETLRDLFNASSVEEFVTVQTT